LWNEITVVYDVPDYNDVMLSEAKHLVYF